MLAVLVAVGQFNVQFPPRDAPVTKTPSGIDFSLSDVNISWRAAVIICETNARQSQPHVLIIKNRMFIYTGWTKIPPLYVIQPLTVFLFILSS
jgi:hypothetical protein